MMLRQYNCRPCWNRIVSIFLLVCAAMTASRALQAGEMRTWTDSSGKNKIEAEFVEVSGTKVVLQKADGTRFQIDLSKLSGPDRIYAMQQQHMPRRGGEPSPFEQIPGKAESGTGKAGAASDTTDAGKVVATVDWASAQNIPVTPTGEWKFTVAAAEEETPAVKKKPVLVPPMIDFFEKLTSIAVSQNSERLVIGYTFEKSPPEKQTRLVLCDLGKGRTLNVFGPNAMNPLALSDDGARVLMCRSQFGWGNNDRLEVWMIGRSGITKQVTWHPYGDCQGMDRDISWAEFLSNDRVATVNHKGKLVVWKADSAQPVYYVQATGGWGPAVSPDRKYIAFLSGRFLELLDVAKAEVVAGVAIPELQGFGRLAFSPRGTRIGCLGIGKLYVWDFATGEFQREVLLTNVHGDKPVWTSENHVLVGNCLVDVEHQVKLWRYDGIHSATQMGATTWFLIGAHFDQPATFLPMSIPQPGVKERLTAALAQPDFFVLKAGTTVKVVTDALPDPAKRDAVRQTLAAKLEQQGCKAAMDGTIDLVASCEVGEEKEVAYHTFGSPGTRTYKIRVHTTRLKFVYGGQTVWETSCNNVPGMVHLKEGQTLEQYLREQERPNYDWLGHVELPKLLANTKGGETIGTSRVTAAGMAEGPAAKPTPKPTPRKFRGRTT